MSTENNIMTPPVQKHLLRSDTFESLAKDFGRPYAIFAILFNPEYAVLPEDFWAECTDSELFDIYAVCDTNNKRSGIVKEIAFDMLIEKGRISAERFSKLFNQAKSFEEKFFLHRKMPQVRESWERKTK